MRFGLIGQSVFLFPSSLQPNLHKTDATCKNNELKLDFLYISRYDDSNKKDGLTRRKNKAVRLHKKYTLMKKTCARCSGLYP